MLQDSPVRPPCVRWGDSRERPAGDVRDSPPSWTFPTGPAMPPHGVTGRHRHAPGVPSDPAQDPRGCPAATGGPGAPGPWSRRAPAAPAAAYSRSSLARTKGFTYPPVLPQSTVLDASRTVIEFLACCCASTVDRSGIRRSTGRALANRWGIKRNCRSPPSADPRDLAAIPSPNRHAFLPSVPPEHGRTGQQRWQIASSLHRAGPVAMTRRQLDRDVAEIRLALCAAPLKGLCLCPIWLDMP